MGFGGAAQKLGRQKDDYSTHRHTARAASQDGGSSIVTEPAKMVSKREALEVNPSM